MVALEFVLATERINEKYEVRYGGMTAENIDKTYEGVRILIEEAHQRVLTENKKLKSIRTEVKIM